jgi:hypothetical protein
MKYRSRFKIPPSSPLTLVTLVSFGLLLALGGCSKDTIDPNLEGGDETQKFETGDEATEAEESAESNSTTVTTDPGDGDGDDTSMSTGFVPEIDGLVTNTCDPAEQDCPDGDKCTGYVVQQGYCCVDANKCVPVIGNAQLGDPCVRTDDNDDCDEGLFCMTVTSGSTGDGVCLAFCNVGTQDCAEDGLPDAQCIAFNDGALPICQDSCDPITQDCDGSLGCYGVGNQGFVCSVPGFEEGLGNDGDMCFTIQSCKPGLGCTAAEVLSDCGASRCCSPYCDLSVPDPCLAPEECIPYYEDGTAPPGYETVGLCAIPA